MCFKKQTEMLNGRFENDVNIVLSDFMFNKLYARTAQ